MNDQNERRRGISLLLIAVCMIPVMDGIAKHLAQTYPVAQITWARYFFGLVLVLPVILFRFGPRSLLVDRMPLQMLRGGCLLAATYTFFLSLRYLPIADTLALAFVYPLIVTALSPVILGEQVGWRRRIAVLVGFLGAMIIIGPGTSVFQPIALLALLPGCFYAGYVMLTRKLAGSAPAAVTLAYGTLLGAIVLSIPMPFLWVPPTATAWMMLVGIAVIASVCHFLTIKAYEAAPASLLAPLGYAEMPAAVLVGFVWFGDLPTSHVWLGIAIIVASGVFISWRETGRS